MRKILVIILALGLFLGGCGGPSAKEDAQAFNNAFESKIYSVHNEFVSDLQTSHQKYKDGRTDKEIANKADSYITKIDTIIDEVTKYNVMNENKHLKSSMLNTLKAQRELFEAAKALGSYKSKEDVANKMTAYENALTNFIDLSLAFDNEMSLVTKGKSTYELTLANYRKIHKGDAYAKVCRLVKMPGTLTNSMESSLPLIGKRVLEHYVWKNGNAYMRIMFENGVVYQMEQEGLK